MTFLLDTNAISELMRADTRVEKWMADLSDEDRVVTCTIVRGEILFGISRLPEGKRRAELEQMGRQFLDAFHCEPIGEPRPGFRRNRRVDGGRTCVAWLGHRSDLPASRLGG